MIPVSYSDASFVRSLLFAFSSIGSDFITLMQSYEPGFLEEISQGESGGIESVSFDVSLVLSIGQTKVSY